MKISETIVIAEKLRRERRFFFEQMRQEPQRRLAYWQNLKRKMQLDITRGTYDDPDCPLALEHDNRKIANEVM